MKAIVHYEYGSPDVIKLIEAEKPTPNEDQVLVKVHTASINSYDWRHMRATPFLVRTGAGGSSQKTPGSAQTSQGRWKRPAVTSPCSSQAMKSMEM